MKKYLGLIVLFLASVMMFPAPFLAESEEKEYNELGIEIGTEVYGEDISELTEEELQYIPKGWRDGVIEEEHQHVDPPEENSTMAVYPDVNNYIQSRNLSVARVEYDHKSQFYRFNYRYGFGRVEGVVAHETANNNSTITGEISYMTRNHNNAFVHAFVDHNRIIEIHPPELGAWGGGRYANQRFVHVELTRVHSFENFAESINNYTDYIASLLYKYDLDIVDADKSGKGTLWSHDAVSRFLGGTNHSDPHGYFARWGYNWNDFVSLVTKKYNAKVAEKEEYTSKLGHFKSGSVRIYKDPNKQSQYFLSQKQYTDEVYYIKQEYEFKGQLYYLLSREASNKEGTIGWVRSRDLNVHEHAVKNTSNDVGGLVIIGNGEAYNKPWGGSKNLQVKNLSAHNGQSFRVSAVETVGSNEWYRGSINGKQVWAHSSNFAKESSASKLGHIRSNDVIITPILGNGSTAFEAGTAYTNAVYYIKKEALVDDKRYYLISTAPSSVTGVVGWVKAEDLSVHDHKGLDSEDKTLYLNGKGSAFSKAWGGSQDLVYNQLTKYKNQEFQVNLTESVGSNTWYRGKFKGKTMWVHSSQVSDAQESATSKLGHIRSNDVLIFPDLGNKPAAFAAGTKYTNAVYYIKKEVVISKQRYYLISTEPSSARGVVGWVKAGDLSVHDHKGLDSKDKTLYLNGKGSAFTKAWGGSKDLVYEKLTNYKNEEFHVNLTETVGSNVWYRGVFNGKTMWVHSSQVTNIKESNTSKLGHIRSDDVKIYSDINSEASAKTAGESYTNAVYYIKQQADVNKQRYYLISLEPSRTSGVVGWVKAEDLSVHDHKGVDSKDKTFYVKGSGSAYSKAWGGAKDLVYSKLSNYKDQKFSVHLTENVGSNTWYRGVLNGQTVWIHSAYVKQ